jgi:hypothetical protein
MLGLTSGEMSLVALLVFAVVSAKFWPAVGAKLAVRLLGAPGTASEPTKPDEGERKSERT